MEGRKTSTEREGVGAWIEPIATAAGAVAGLVIFVHLLGGIVMWLRFRKAGLPADQAVALMSREQMLTVGLRLIVLPMIVSGILAIALVLLGKRRSVDGRFGTALRRVLLGLSSVVVLVLFYTLPASWASLTWVALVLVIFYWWRGFGARHRPADQLSSWRLAAVAVLAAAIISLGRQIDQPVQLLQTTVALGSGAHATQVEGVFVAASDTAVYVGNTATHKITAIRRDDVTSITLGPPLERAPNRSLLSWLSSRQEWSLTPLRWWCHRENYPWGDGGPLCPTTHGSPLSALASRDRWSLTPLRWWCNGEEYALTDAGLLCHTQPKPVLEQRRGLDVRWIPVRISCPKTRKEPCEGYLRLTTRETYSRALGRYAESRLVSFPHEGHDGVHFTAPRGRTREVCVPTSRDEQELLRAKSDVKRSKGDPVPLTAVLTSDPAGASEMSRAPLELDVAGPDAGPSMMVASDCGRALRAKLAKQRARPSTARAVLVPDAHELIVRAHGTAELVRLLGIRSPSSKSYEKARCGEPEGTAALLRLVFTRPRDTNGDGLVDKPGGRARRLRLEPDNNQPNRAPYKSYLLRYVRVAGARDTLQESALRSGWARVERSHGKKLKLAARLERAARAGKRVAPNLDSKC